MKVLITGITGSIGNALAQRFHSDWEITGFSRDELKQADMKRKYPDIRFLIGDVSDYHAVYKAMRGIDAVVHTAAMKRIEVCEANPTEAVKTNVRGAENVARAAYQHGVKKAVVIGSDKGVEPICIYGVTKAAQEEIFTSYGYNVVRYGNVFGSRGSVVPLFIALAKQGKPLPLTDPEMTRFMLPIDDAIELILKALNNPMQGDIYVKKSPATKLIDLANAFSSNIKVIGIVGREKKHDVLISSHETTRVREIEDDFAVIGKEELREERSESYASDKERTLSVDEIKELAKRYIEQATE